MIALSVAGVPPQRLRVVAAPASRAGADPWGGQTLEWATTSPPPRHNFTPRCRRSAPTRRCSTCATAEAIAAEEGPRRGAGVGRGCSAWRLARCRRCVAVRPTTSWRIAPAGRARPRRAGGRRVGERAARGTRGAARVPRGAAASAVARRGRGWRCSALGAGPGCGRCYRGRLLGARGWSRARAGALAMSGARRPARRAARRRRRCTAPARGACRGWPAWRGAVFAAGLAARPSRCSALDAGALGPAHMVQHLVLGLVAAPLLVARLAGARSRSRATRRPPRARAGLRWRAAGRVGLGGARGAMAVSHLPGGLRRRRSRHPPLHVAEHAAWLVAAVLFWRPVARRRPGARTARARSGGCSTCCCFRRRWRATGAWLHVEQRAVVRRPRARRPARRGRADVGRRRPGARRDHRGASLGGAAARAPPPALAVRGGGERRMRRAPGCAARSPSCCGGAWRVVGRRRRPVAAHAAAPARRAAGPRRPRSSPRGARPATARTCAGARGRARRCAAPARRRPTSTCSTGRMPLADPTTSPSRAAARRTRAPTSTRSSPTSAPSAGPAIPRVDPAPRRLARGHGAVHRATAPAATRSSGAAGSSPAPPSRRSQDVDADPDRRGRPRRAVPDAEVLRAPDRRSARSTTIARYVAVDPPPGRPRRLGHRQHRADPRGHGRVAAGASVGAARRSRRADRGAAAVTRRRAARCGIGRSARPTRGADPPAARASARPRASSLAALLGLGRLAVAFAVLIVVDPQTQLLGATLGARPGLRRGRADARRQARRRRARSRSRTARPRDGAAEDDAGAGRRTCAAAATGSRAAARWAPPGRRRRGARGRARATRHRAGPEARRPPDEHAVAPRARGWSTTTASRCAPTRIEVGSFSPRCPRAPTSASSARPVVVVRVDPATLRLPRATPRRGRPTGILAFSKICTHAGCAVSLFRYPLERADLQGPALVCPCHYSTFDVTRGAEPVFGPAGRAAAAAAAAPSTPTAGCAPPARCRAGRPGLVGREAVSPV